MLANKALVTAHGSTRSRRPNSPRPIAISTAHSFTETVSRRTSYVIAINVPLHHVARWQLARYGNSLLSAFCYDFFQLPLRAMDRTDGNAGFSRDRAHADAGRMICAERQ
jgi:hypothetical protein